jgi:ubiquinone/menaquinone biosynthesis C-methylase UbiE
MMFIYLWFSLVFAVFLLVFATYLLLGSRSGAPFVPTGKKNIARMMALANVQPGEVCMDLGAGTGRIVFAAAKSGATCVGVELNPFLHWWGKMRALIGRHTNVSFSRADLWKTDLSHVDVLTIFFIKSKMPALKEKILQEMKPGTRIVSNIFTFPEWPYEKKDGHVYLYRVR